MHNNTSNDTTSWKRDEAPFNQLEQPEYREYKIAAYCLIIVLSLVGNSLVIAVIYKNANQRMRTPHNYFVVNMAVGDGLITVVNMVTEVVVLFFDSRFPFGGIVGVICCKIQNFMWIFLISWSTGSLSAIAVDRFLLVFVPLKQIITLRIARGVVAAIIVIGAAISSPYLVFSTVVAFGDYNLCFVNVSNFEVYRVYFLSLFTMFIFFPFVILLVLYSAVALKLWLRKFPGNQENRVRMNRRIFPQLITIVLLFFFCWIPISSIIFSCVAVDFDSISCRILMDDDAIFTLWFVAFSNSAINPYVYFIFNEHFRHGARVIWSSIRCRCTGVFNRDNQIDTAVELHPTGLQVT